jgi:hypothetical protein
VSTASGEGHRKCQRRWVRWRALAPIMSMSHDNEDGAGPPVGLRVVPTTALTVVDGACQWQRRWQVMVVAKAAATEVTT